MAFENYQEAPIEDVVPTDVEYGCEVAGSGGVETSQAGGSRTRYWYRISRRIRRTYKIKGLSKAACQACLAAKRRQFMRRFPVWEFTANGWGFYRGAGFAPSDDIRDAVSTYKPVAEIAVQRTGDAPVWDVQITLDETVVLYRFDVNVEMEDFWGVIASYFSRSDLSYAPGYSYDA